MRVVLPLHRAAITGASSQEEQQQQHMERKRKVDVYEDGPRGGYGGGGQQTAAPPDGGASSINPYTGRPYSQRYHTILATRHGGWYQEKCVLMCARRASSGLLT